jgi:hypothetical protein
MPRDYYKIGPEDPYTCALCGVLGKGKVSMVGEKARVAHNKANHPECTGQKSAKRSYRQRNTNIGKFVIEPHPPPLRTL